MRKTVAKTKFPAMKDLVRVRNLVTWFHGFENLAAKAREIADREFWIDFMQNVAVEAYETLSSRDFQIFCRLIDLDPNEVRAWVRAAQHAT